MYRPKTGTAAALAVCVIAMLALPPSVVADRFTSNESGKRYEDTHKGRATADWRQRRRTGQFDGYNAEARRVWIDDTAFELHPALQVRGNAKRLGLLSDIKPGEQIDFTARYNTQRSGLPVLVEIRRH